MGHVTLDMSRDSVSPVCGIVNYINKLKKKKRNLSLETAPDKWKTVEQS